MHGTTVPGGADDAEHADLAACLTAIDAALTGLLEARDVRGVSGRACPSAARPLARTVNQLMRHPEEIAAFVLPLSRGELVAPRPSPDNLMATALVARHARLRRRTSQTRKIAHGDYSQRIDFMGEVSRAFNSMVALLAERDQNLKAEIARRRQAGADLQRERDLLVSGPVVTFRRG
jgi:hypothetical protein